MRWGDRYDTRPEDIERRNERTWYATHYTPILAATSAVVDEPADQQHIPSFGAAP